MNPTGESVNMPVPEPIFTALQVEVKGNDEVAALAEVACTPFTFLTMVTLTSAPLVNLQVTFAPGMSVSAMPPAIDVPIGVELAVHVLDASVNPFKGNSVILNGPELALSK